MLERVNSKLASGGTRFSVCALILVLFGVVTLNGLSSAEDGPNDTPKPVIGEILTTKVENECVGKGLYEDFDFWRRVQFVAAYYTNPDLRERAIVLDPLYAVPVTAELAKLKVDDDNVVGDSILIPLKEGTEKSYRFTVVTLPCVLPVEDRSGSVRSMTIEDVYSLLKSQKGESSVIEDLKDRAYVVAKKGSGLEAADAMTFKAAIAWNPETEVAVTEVTRAERALGK